MTALLASLAVDLRAGLVIALTHTLFNLLSILTFYPVPAVRYVPVRLAERLATVAVRQPSLVGAYVVGIFLVAPSIGILLFR